MSRSRPFEALASGVTGWAFHVSLPFFVRIRAQLPVFPPLATRVPVLNGGLTTEARG